MVVAQIDTSTRIGSAGHAAPGRGALAGLLAPIVGGGPPGLILFFVGVAALISTRGVQARLLDAGSEAGFAARLGVVVAYGSLAGLAGMGAAAWTAGGYGSGFWAAAGLVALAS